MTKTSLNFGALKDTITKKATIEMARENKNSTLVAFMEAVSRSPILKKQHLVYKNFEKTKPFEHPRLAERFIEQNLRIVEGMSWQELQEQNATLRQHLLGGPDECTVMAKKDNEVLFEHVSTIIESKINRNFKNFDKDALSYQALVEHLTRKNEGGMNEETERPKADRFWRFVTKNALNRLNEGYAALDEDGRGLFGVLISEGKTKKEGVEKLRSELKEAISERLMDAKSPEDKAILESFRGKVSKEVSDEVLLSDDYIISCFELKGTLEGH